MPVMSRGNREMIQRIRSTGTPTLRRMWEDRDDNLLQLFRVCSKPEAFNTWFYCLAGGEYRDLSAEAPTETAAVEQVGNNEGISRGGGVDPRLAVLQKLAKQGVKVNLGPPKARELVECSYRPATQFSGCVIKLAVNKAYTKPGSGLEFEGGGGIVIQIGTPLAWVEAEEKDIGW